MYSLPGKWSGSFLKNWIYWDFRGGPVVKNLPANAGDVGLIPGQGTKTQHSQINKYTLKNKKLNIQLP